MRSLNGYLPDSTYQGKPLVEVVDFAEIDALKVVPPALSMEYRVPEFLPCFDQLIWGSCVLQAWVGLLEILKGLEDGQVEPLSIAWLYAQCRLAQKDFDNDTGTWPYLAADRIKNVGVVPASVFPYVVENLPRTPQTYPNFRPVHPSPAIYVEASDNKIDTLYRIDDSNKKTLLDSIALSVRANKPVVWGCDYNVAELTDWYKDRPPLGVPKMGNGLHATLITGVRDSTDGSRAFRVRNSWGPQFGDNGYFWASSELVATGFDFWTGSRMPKLLV